MKKVTFILGGARSGKSSHAADLAKKTGKKTAFIATAQGWDKEMKARIRRHKLSRPHGWKTVEEATDVSAALKRLDGGFDTVLIDCMGFLISNLLGAGLTDSEVARRMKNFVSTAKKTKANLIIVSNEVGSGIVPANGLSRRFRDTLGLSNQLLAKAADEVILMQSGIPVKIK